MLIASGLGDSGTLLRLPDGGAGSAWVRPVRPRRSSDHDGVGVAAPDPMADRASFLLTRRWEAISNPTLFRCVPLRTFRIGSRIWPPLRFASFCVASPALCADPGLRVSAAMVRISSWLPRPRRGSPRAALASRAAVPFEPVGSESRGRTGPRSPPTPAALLGLQVFGWSLGPIPHPLSRTIGRRRTP